VSWLRDCWPGVARGGLASASWDDLATSLNQMRAVIEEVRQRSVIDGEGVANLDKFERRVMREGNLYWVKKHHSLNKADAESNLKLQGAQNNVAGVHVA
jgi:hypothetical protein